MRGFLEIGSSIAGGRTGGGAVFLTPCVICDRTFPCFLAFSNNFCPDVRFAVFGFKPVLFPFVAVGEVAATTRTRLATRLASREAYFSLTLAAAASIASCCADCRFCQGHSLRSNFRK